MPIGTRKKYGGGRKQMKGGENDNIIWGLIKVFMVTLYLNIIQGFFNVYSREEDST